MDMPSSADVINLIIAKLSLAVALTHRKWSVLRRIWRVAGTTSGKLAKRRPILIQEINIGFLSCHRQAELAESYKHIHLHICNC